MDLFKTLLHLHPTEESSRALLTPHTSSPCNHFLSIHTNLVEFRFCRLLLKQGFIAVAPGRRCRQVRTMPGWRLHSGCAVSGLLSCHTSQSLTFSPKNKGWKTPGITHGTVTVAQGRALQWQSNKGTGDNSHLLSIQLDPCSSSSSKHYPRGTCACPHTTRTQFPAGRT